MATRLFNVSRTRETLVLELKRSVSSLVEDTVQAELASVISELHAGGARNVVIDFSRTGFFGSIMLEALRRIWTQARLAGGKMAICGVNERAAEVLRLSKFDTIWPVCPSRDDALNSVERP